MAEPASALFPVLERLKPKAYDLSPEGYAATGVEIVRWLAAFLCDPDEPVTAPVHELIGERLGLSDDPVNLVRRLLVLCLDYELSFTAFAVRTAADADISPYLAVVVGFGSFRGRRLRFGRAEMISLFLREILTAPNPETPVLSRYRLGEPLPGFEENPSREADPRAGYLLAHIRRLFAGDTDTEKLLGAMETARSLYGRSPEFILLLFVKQKIGMADKQRGIAGIARSGGLRTPTNSTPLRPPKGAVRGSASRVLIWPGSLHGMISCSGSIMPDFPVLNG